MALVTDIVLFLAALGVAAYCRVIAVRLRRLGDTDKGLGGAIATLSAQAEDLRAALLEAQEATNRQSDQMAIRTRRAEAAADRLEILLAAMHEPDQPDLKPTLPTGSFTHQKTPQKQPAVAAMAPHKESPVPRFGSSRSEVRR